MMPSLPPIRGSFVAIKDGTETTLAAATLLALFWGWKGRLWITKTLVLFWQFFTGKTTRDFRGEVRAYMACAVARNTATDAMLAETVSKVDKLSTAMFNGGKKGVAQLVSRLDARDSANFESANWPGFDCDGEGNNERVNHAFRALIGVTRTEDLLGAAWQRAICGPYRDAYLAELKRCADSKEDFMGRVHFRNPFTEESRGFWKIYAPCADLGEVGGLSFTGRFSSALDDEARKITLDHGWEMW